MTENFLTLLATLSPAVFVATAVASWFQPGCKPKQIIAISKTATIVSILVVVLSSIYVTKHGLLESGLLGISGIGFSIRLDALSILMLGMIALLGFIIIKFSSNYLDGDQRQGAFIGKLAATIASVQLLVISGNIGLLFVSWVLTSISLHRLLVFYHERPGAQVAAKKKFILARLGDGCLLVAIAFLYNQFGSGNLEVIFSAIKGGLSAESSSLPLELSALFLALAAILKSAQFPTHGWLIEVMETPTPVSALLHAGLLNAGPFLIIRMAFVMDASTVAPILLLSLGGFTALFASVAYLTQTSIKTALGYSSVGHMGFSLMVCGLGVYPAATLHLVAHSFYKAHAFLSSGSVIDLVRASKVADQAQTLSPIKVASGIAMALLLYTGFALLWGIDPQRELSLLFIGAVIVMGLSRIFTAAIARSWNPRLMARAVLLALTVTAAFFALESGTHLLLGSQVPELTVPGLGKILLVSVILLGFGLIVFMQIIAPQLSKKPYYQELAVHVRNGFYANACFDRLIQALTILSPESRQELVVTAPTNSHSGSGLTKRKK
ncbi:proton-conducting transporter transmembrane domain-containing protein [Cyclobacterium jeungdonense]|uniref:Probable inorganic carbon transporter subunit DabB n=1 Tax=Cyclobacterium jeungdonense TaxID=708087 RepID=A0ABT8C3F5_9BACT|nr:proton-conducting transporter membrane subunit [Cyclobacterium jeungdonense]MDN3687308.1 proton-conducting transporter membrane subunit [Cyclobacterium jeungdonense]